MWVVPPNWVGEWQGNNFLLTGRDRIPVGSVVEVATLMDGSWGMGWPRGCYGLSQVETQMLIKQSVSL